MSSEKEGEERRVGENGKEIKKMRVVYKGGEC